MTHSSIRKRINFRELGGYKTEDGKTVKYGLLYRSGALCDLKEKERKIVDELNLKHIFDLRSDSEIARLPDPVIAGAEYHPAGAIEEDASVSGLRRLMQRNTRYEHLKYLYGILPFCSAYRQIFAYLKKGEVPVLFHCSAGKDRTGVLAYLILRALGCSHETASRDYLLSNRYRAGEIRMYLDEVAAVTKMTPKIEHEIRALAGAAQENIDHTLEAIEKRYGTIETYFEQALECSEEDIRRLREMYTESRGN